MSVSTAVPALAPPSGAPTPDPSRAWLLSYATRLAPASTPSDLLDAALTPELVASSAQHIAKLNVPSADALPEFDGLRERWRDKIKTVLHPNPQLAPTQSTLVSSLSALFPAAPPPPPPLLDPVLPHLPYAPSRKSLRLQTLERALSALDGYLAGALAEDDEDAHGCAEGEVLMERVDVLGEVRGEDRACVKEVRWRIEGEEWQKVGMHLSREGRRLQPDSTLFRLSCVSFASPPSSSTVSSPAPCPADARLSAIVNRLHHLPLSPPLYPATLQSKVDISPLVREGANTLQIVMLGQCADLAVQVEKVEVESVVVF